MRIGIDAMGGDHAPDAILAGSLDALSYLSPDDRLILIGDREVILDVMAERGAAKDPRIEVVHTSQVISMNESPVEAIRTKTDSSIVRMARMGGHRHGATADHCDIVISAGNTGACVAACQMEMRRLPGVHRPGFAITLPTMSGPLVICDVGANPEPKPHHLHQYGHMAGAFAGKIHNLAAPRVALMSIGGEEGKGNTLTKESSKLMKADPTLNYIGYVEGRDLFNGKTDIVITEGFTGNVILKLAEGLVAGLFKMIAHEIFAVDPQLAMRFEPVVKSIYSKHDYHEYGGAPLLGANGSFFKCHGSSEARTIKSAIRNAMKFHRLGINDAIVQALARYEAATASTQGVSEAKE